MLMIGAVVVTIATRVPVELDVIRDRGALFSYNGNGWVENTYTLKINNMAEVPREFRIGLEGIETARLLRGNEPVQVAAGDLRSVPVVVEVNPDDLDDINTSITFRIEATDDSGVSDETDSRFVGPRPR